MLFPIEKSFYETDPKRNMDLSVSSCIDAWRQYYEEKGRVFIDTTIKEYNTIRVCIGRTEIIYCETGYK